MDYIKRLLGYHKTPPVLVDASLFELDCVIRQITPKHGRRLSKRFWQMKNFLFGKGDRDPSMDECEELSMEIIRKHVVIKVMLAFPKLSFDERKSFVQVFCTLLSRNHYKFATEYMVSPEGCDILLCIVNGCGDQSLAINSGLMLRECIKLRSIHQILLTTPGLVEPIFTEYVFNENFDICSDIFQTIRDLLRRNKQLVSVLLIPSKPLYNQLFGWYRKIILNKNYVIIRIAIKLLGEILLDKINFDIMIAYIGDVENLKLFMNLLISDFPSIRYDAFQIFKIFVANPDRTPEVEHILRLNKKDLLNYLSSFLPEKDGDEVFVDEKRLLVNILNRLSDL